VAGYAWLLALWLIARPGEDFGDTRGFESVKDLAATIGPVATAGAVSVIAYLLGSISQGVGSWTVRRLRSLGPYLLERWGTSRLPRNMWPFEVEEAMLGRSSGLTPGRPMATTHRHEVEAVRGAAKSAQGIAPSQAPRFDSLLEEALRAPYQDRTKAKEIDDLIQTLAAESALEADSTYFSNSAPAHQLAEIDADLVAAPWVVGGVIPDELTTFLEDLAYEDWSPQEWLRLVLASRRYAQRAADELELPATLLVGQEPLAFAEADRERSEGEFRLAIVPPMIALTVILTVQHGLLWLCMLLGTAVLAAQGVVRERASRDIVRQTIRFKKLEPPAVARFRELVEAHDSDARPTSD
jgi:hypothetical protein